MVPCANGTFLGLNGASVGGADGSPGFWALSSFCGRSLLSHCQRCVLADSSGLSGSLMRGPKTQQSKTEKKTHAPWPHNGICTLTLDSRPV